MLMEAEVDQIMPMWLMVVLVVQEEMEELQIVAQEQQPRERLTEVVEVVE
jgi:hypothetical protein